jgi:hypothetical protein
LIFNNDLEKKEAMLVSLLFSFALLASGRRHSHRSSSGMGVHCWGSGLKIIRNFNDRERPVAPRKIIWSTASKYEEEVI